MTKEPMSEKTEYKYARALIRKHRQLGLSETKMHFADGYEILIRQALPDKRMTVQRTRLEDEVVHVDLPGARVPKTVRGMGL